MWISIGRQKQKGTLISDLLERHLGKPKPEDLTIAERQFPHRVRADLQRGLEEIISGEKELKRFCGISQFFSHEGPNLAALIAKNEPNPSVPVPPEYEEIDIGEDHPVRCLKIGLWLLGEGDVALAILVASYRDMHRGQSLIRVQIATFNNERGTQARDRIFNSLEKTINNCRSYRGKILSLEDERDYLGRSVGIKVHKLRTVTREQVILPKTTLTLLERNVIQFVRQREQLAGCGQATKKGILFYGPPGTGKSHTIHYLAQALKGHTMLLITAEQTRLLSQYMSLARLLQPSVVVIEDVDLIARDRVTMNNSCDQALLNKLLNEMDGLKESADILFILTTNRPEELEAALASRPGRVDQAIEFPLPDEAGREKLARLYSAGASISEELMKLVVAKTENVSAAFIKELMRRSVQFQLERGDGKTLDAQDIQSALEEMLFTGGALNAKLLGAERSVGFHTQV
jgi:cell division protease FtsH